MKALFWVSVGIVCSLARISWGHPSGDVLEEEPAERRHTRAKQIEFESIPFSAEEQQNLVDLHNAYRRTVVPEASNMQFMASHT